MVKLVIIKYGYCDNENTNYNFNFMQLQLKSDSFQGDCLTAKQKCVSLFSHDCFFAFLPNIRYNPSYICSIANRRTIPTVPE